MKCELYNDHFQNYKRYNIPKAQLVIADIPYNLGNNAYASNPVWYVDGDNKNGESALAGKQFFNTDKDFRIAEYFHFCNRLLKKEPKEKGQAPAMIVFCAFEQCEMVRQYGEKHGFKHSYPIFFIKNYSAQVLKANMKIVGATEYGLVLYREKLPKFNNGRQYDENGKVLSAQLPSYVDDVEEYESQGSFPTEGEAGKIYIDTSTNITYRWSGTVYTPIGSDLALGETSSSAYRGDKGKIAYDHSQITHAPADAEKNQNAFSRIGVGKLDGNGMVTYTMLNASSPNSEVYLKCSNLELSTSGNTVTIGVNSASTSNVGIVKLTDGTSSTSTTTAATPNSVKNAYDLASTAHSLALTRASKDVATATKDGLMSAADKANLDALVASAVTVLSGTTEPTADMGNEGDIYLVLEE